MNRQNSQNLKFDLTKYWINELLYETISILWTYRCNKLEVGELV